MLEQEGHGEVSPIQLLQEDQQHQNHYHSHHQGHIHLPLSTPLPLATPLIPIFLPKESQLLASREEKDPGTSEVYSLSALLTEPEKHNYHMVEQQHEASKRIGKPMQLQGLENEKERGRLTAKIREDYLITGVEPVTSIWHQRLPLAHKNTTQPDKNVDSSIISHLGSEPLYSRTLAGRNDEPDVSFVGSLLFPPENISSTWNLGYGAVENNIRQSFPVIFGNANNSNNGQKFASVTRQAPFQTPPVSYTPQSSIIHGDSNTQQLSHPDLSQLLRVVQLALSEDLEVKDYLSQLTSSPVPPVSFAPSTFGVKPFNSEGFQSSISPDQTAWQTAPSNNVIQLPQNYQNYAFHNLSIPYQEQDLQNDPVSPGIRNPENEPNYFGDEPYIPALGSPLDNPQFTNFDLRLTPDATVIAQPSAEPVAASSSSTVGAATTSTSSVTDCLANSLCALLAATALALGASTAVALPFIATGISGRRKRNVDNSFLTPKNVTEFVNDYISYIKNGSVIIPWSEHVFSALLDPTNDSARDIFKKLEKQIIKNKDKLPNFILRETPLKGPIPIPDEEILAIINTKTGGVPELPEVEVEDTLASEQGNTGARDVTHVHMTRSYGHGSNTLISSKPPAALVQTLDTEYTHDNGKKQDLQDTGVATRSTMQPSTVTQHGSPYSPLNDRLKSSLAGARDFPYASNDLHPPESVRILDSLRPSALQSLPLNYYSLPLPKYIASAAPRTHDDPGTGMVINGTGMLLGAQSQGIAGSPLRPKTATFYRIVCGTLDPHIPDNDIIKFIANKCSILQRVGII